MIDLTLYEIAKFIFLSGASGVVGNLTTEGLKKISAFFTRKGRKEEINKLYEILESGNRNKFEEFLNYLDEDTKTGFINILREL